MSGYLPQVVGSFLRSKGESIPRDFLFDPQLEDLSRVFYDAAWRLCRIGVLRPTVTWFKHTTSVGQPAAGNGYSFTSAGRSWITESELVFIPADPGRYVGLLSKEVSRLAARGESR